MADAVTDHKLMSIGDHLDELRRRLIFALIGMAVAAAAMLILGRRIIHIVCLPLFEEMKSQGLHTAVHTFSPPEGFTVYLKVSLVTGLAVAAPWTLYQGWKFVSAGMYDTERRVVLVLLPFSGFMSILGLAFTYFVMLPIILWFFINFIQQYPQPASTTPDAPNTATADPPPGKITILERDPANPADGDAWIKMPEGELRIHFNAQTLSVALSAGAASMVTFNPRLSDYISFVTMVAIGIVVAFQKPVVMFVLGWTGLVDPRWLSKYRRHCIVACFAMGMLLTPSDVVSMVVLAMPLWGLFELGLLLMRIVYRPPDVAGES